MSRPRPLWRPPTRDGVGPSCVATLPGAWPTAADFLAERLPVLDAAQWRERMAAGDVLSVDGRPLPPDAPHVAHTKLWYWRALPAEPHIPFEAEVLFQDELLVAVDKPHFLPMTPKGRYVQETLLVRLKRRLGIDTLVPMHRLDRETAGVVLFTVQPATRHAYQSLLRDRSVEKVYEAVAPWRGDLALPHTRSSRLQERAEAFMQMAEVAGEPNAQTRIELIRRVACEPALAHYRLSPLTGQKHQLRTHMAALGVPICGDRIYPVLQPDTAPGAEPDYSQPLQLLARSIGFVDPVSGAARRFESRRTLARLTEP